MTEQSDNTNRNDVADWWATAIIDMVPGEIRIRGHPIQTLIGTTSFAQTIWLMTRGKIPSESEARLLECALVAAVDHGPQAPSIAAARMAVTCGLPLNAALGSAVSFLDDVHGGAGEQAVELYTMIAEAIAAGSTPEAACQAKMEQWQKDRSEFIPGFGHRFHKPEDPRAPRLLALAEHAAREGTISGHFVTIGKCIQNLINGQKDKPVPMNIDGATAVIFAELGFPPPLARGLFCISRSVGIIAHAWEQMNQGGRNKGPTPPHYRWTYTGDNPIQPKSFKS